ncbi:MAG: tetratricopeptide repeat protein [Deltaproteobacteria bacterium]
MKRLLLLLIVWMLCATISCGGKAALKEPDPLQPARKELHKGINWYQKGCYHNALPHLLRAHELFTARDDLPGIAMSLNNIGNVYGKLKDPESAVLFFDSSHAIYRDIDDTSGAVQALSNKAAVLIRGGNLDDAEATLEAAQKLLDRSGGQQPSLLSNWGVLLTRKEAYAEAEKKLMAALEASDPENHSQSASIHFSLGNLKSATGQYDEGLEHYRKALDHDRQSGFHQGIADDLAAIGELYQREGEHTAAASHFQRSIKIYALLGNEDRVIDVMAMLEESAGEANVDIAVTRHFISQWARGEILESPCP